MKPNGKKKIKSIHYRKQFRSFSDAIIEATQSCPILSNLLQISEGEEDISIEKIYSRITELAAEYTPNIVKRENMLWEFQISGNNVSVKTDQYISFGWNIRSEPERNEDSTTFYNIYNFRITFFGDSLNDNAKVLQEKGWTTKNDTEE